MATHTRERDPQMPDKPEAAKGGMRVETWIFLGLTAFFALAAVIYRRLEQARPEDNDDAEVSDGAGDVGFFSPGSYWPFALAFSAAFVAYATAFLLVWLMIIGIGFLLFSICGLIFEYHRRPAH
jgi:hypothetical protein